MDMNITLGQLLAIAIPSAIVSFIGYFLRKTLDGIETGIAKVNGRLDLLDTKLDDHNDRLARVETRLDGMERELAEVKALKERRTR